MSSTRFPKPLSGKSSQTLRRTKSSKKSKKSKKSLVAKEDEDLENFKPATLDDEYASELGKISKILRAVSSVSSKQESDGGKTGEHFRGRGSEWNTKNEVELNSIHRPLSGSELKQLLSSITRVVSLHQLPIHNQNSVSTLSSGLHGRKPSVTDHTKNETSNAEVPADNSVVTAPFSDSEKNTKKKRRKKVKSSSSHFPKNRNEEAQASKFRFLSNRSSRSKASVKRSKPKGKSTDRTRLHKPVKPDGVSSLTSLDKDPVQHAMFLKKYFEESTRLANARSSEELIDENQPADENDKASSVSKRKVKKKGSNLPTTRDTSASKYNKSSTPLAKKATSQRSLPQSLSGSKKYDKIGKSKQKGERITDFSGAFKNQSVSKSQKPTSKQKRPNKQKLRKKNNVSTTAIAGTPTASSPVYNQGDGENILRLPKDDTAKRISIESKNPTKLPESVIFKFRQPTASIISNKQVQFKNLEEILDGTFSGNGGKTKSIWEKTPYQPMTHSRFKDMVSKYADPEASLAFSQGEEDRMSMHSNIKTSTVVPLSYSEGLAPGNLLTLPKPWEIKERLAEEAKRDKTIKELQAPPLHWSNTASTYNRLDLGNKYSLRKDPRHVRKAMRDIAKSRP